MIKKSKNKSVIMKEYNDGATEVKDIKVRISYDPVFNVFFLQAQDAQNTTVATDYASDNENNPNVETNEEPDSDDVIYGGGVRRCKVQSTPDVDLLKILARLNARPDKVTGEEVEQTEDVSDISKDVMDSLSPEIKDVLKGLDKQKKDVVKDNEDANYGYDVQRNDTLTSMVKEIIDNGEGIILVTGFDWSNANLPTMKESLADDYFNTDMDVDTLLRESVKYNKNKIKNNTK